MPIGTNGPLNVNEPCEPFSPETMGECAELLHKLYGHFLCDVDEAPADVFAKQHFLIALDLMQQAERNLRLAQLHQTRAIAGKA